MFAAVSDSTRQSSRHIFRQWWRQAERLAGITREAGLGYHSLRRAFATALKHAPLKDLCELGWLEERADNSQVLPAGRSCHDAPGARYPPAHRPGQACIAQSTPQSAPRARNSNWGGRTRTSNFPVNSRAVCQLTYTPPYPSHSQARGGITARPCRRLERPRHARTRGRWRQRNERNATPPGPRGSGTGCDWTLERRTSSRAKRLPPPGATSKTRARTRHPTAWSTPLPPTITADTPADLPHARGPEETASTSSRSSRRRCAAPSPALA